MNKWEYTTIGEHCIVTSSKRFHISDRSTTGVPFYCSKEIIQKVNGEDVSDCDYIKEESYENVKVQYGVPERGDLLITTRGTYGIPYIYRDVDKFYFADGNLTWLKNFDDELLVKYLYYWILSYEGQKKIDAIAKGTAQKAVPIASIKLLQLPLPRVDVQKRIADILSSYDDLIENNRRQIKLLEEAAQRLYKEWFVDLRFPGYEETPIVDGVPAGWERTSFSKKVEIMSGGTPKTSNPEYYKGEIPFYSPKDSDGSFFAFDTETHISELGLYNCNSKLYPPGTVIVTARGTVGKTTILSVPMAMNQSCYALKSEMLSSVYYLFFALRKEIATLKAMANGGVFDTIIVKTFDSISLLDPGKRLINQFDHEVTPIMDSIKIKMQNNSLLAESRDRLLPKLMSGEIEV